MTLIFVIFDQLFKCLNVQFVKLWFSWIPQFLSFSRHCDAIP